MNLKNRICKLEAGLATLQPVKSNAVVIFAITAAEFEQKVDEYNRANPLEPNFGPEPSRIFLRFRRAEPDLEMRGGDRK